MFRTQSLSDQIDAAERRTAEATAAHDKQAAAVAALVDAGKLDDARAASAKMKDLAAAVDFEKSVVRRLAEQRDKLAAEQAAADQAAALAAKWAVVNDLIAKRQQAADAVEEAIATAGKGQEALCKLSAELDQAVRAVGVKRGSTLAEIRPGIEYSVIANGLHWLIADSDGFTHGQAGLASRVATAHAHIASLRQGA